MDYLQTINELNEAYRKLARLRGGQPLYDVQMGDNIDYMITRLLNEIMTELLK